MAKNIICGPLGIKRVLTFDGLKLLKTSIIIEIIIKHKIKIVSILLCFMR